jgi:hypothetical protein
MDMNAKPHRRATRLAEPCAMPSVPYARHGMPQLLYQQQHKTNITRATAHAE